MFIIDLVANLRELYLRNYECVNVRTDLYMQLHTELGRLCNKLTSYNLYVFLASLDSYKIQYRFLTR